MLFSLELDFAACPTRIIGVAECASIRIFQQSESKFVSTEVNTGNMLHRLTVWSLVGCICWLAGP